MNRILLSVACLAAVSFAGVAQADDVEQYQKIRKLLSEGNLSAAEETFQAATEEYPDSARLKSLHYLLYAYNNRDENYEVAREHLEAYIALNILPTEEKPEGNLASLPSFAGRLLSIYGELEQQQKGADRLDELLTQVEEIADRDQDNALAQIALREMRNRKLLFLAETGQKDEAKIALTTRVSAAEEAVKKQPDDDKSLLDLMFLLKGEFELARELKTGDAKEKQKQFLTRLMAAASEHKKNAPLVITALNEYVSAAGIKSFNHPDEAEALLHDLKEFADSIESDDESINSRLTSTNRSMPLLNQRIEAGKNLAGLIGKDAFPLEAEAWVNGDPLTDADLKGKVVLLDFWAVWCGPCIATFPHLREWREEYKDKGLVIIGVTSYYNFGWNEETNRPERQPQDEEKLTPEEEQAAMLKFAEHYELKHRFMITPQESGFKQDYRVSAIPQAVLIDRDGKIRLIRVGSGAAIAEDIGSLLTELIGDEK